MRKDLQKMMFVPLPVVLIGTYDENGKGNMMNAAWAGIYDYGKIIISLSKHKTTENLELKKEFTISFATSKTVVVSDYFGLVSGYNEDKIKKAGLNEIKAKYVDAPLYEEFPLSLECKVVSFNDDILIGEVVNTSIDENYILEDGTIDIEKMEIICYDMTTHSYRLMGKKVGNAFKDGLKLK